MSLMNVTNLSAGYGSGQIIFGLSLQIPPKGAVAVLGRNGAGKTTLLKTLAGELKANSGSITFGERTIHDRSPEERSRLGLGHVPQDQSVFAGLTVRENLQLGASWERDFDGVDMATEIFPKLGRRLHQIAGTLSGGERKMLAISRALVGRPRLLMLDEPTEGVWVGVIEEIAQRLVMLRESMAILLVEQHVELALRVADYAYVMNRGEIAFHGAAGDVRDDARLSRFLAP